MVDVQFDASGFRPWLYRAFAATPAPFSWGISDVSGRDAAIALLGRSATSLTWRLFCYAQGKIEGASCALALRQIIVAAPGS